MDGKRNVRGCLKVGCIGCVALVALPVVAGIFIAVAMLFVGEAEVDFQDERLERNVPLVDVLELPENVEPVEFDGRSFRLTPEQVSEPPAGHVELQLSLGSFEIVAGDPGEPLRVESRYDTGSFKLEESYETNPDGTWKYKLRFGRKGSWIRMLRGETNAGKNKVRLVLPRGTPIELAGKITMGESRLDLGGLWLVSSDIDFGMGEHKVDFDEPLYGPMQSFRADMSMGALRIGHLGEASPERVEVEHSMGELDLDLRGNWVRDATIRTKSGMGEGRVNLPHGVGIEVEKARISLGEKTVRVRDRPPDPGRPTLRLDARHSMGELRIQ